MSRPVKNCKGCSALTKEKVCVLGKRVSLVQGQEEVSKRGGACRSKCYNKSEVTYYLELQELCAPTTSSKE